MSEDMLTIVETLWGKPYSLFTQEEKQSVRKWADQLCDHIYKMSIIEEDLGLPVLGKALPSEALIKQLMMALPKEMVE